MAVLARILRIWILVICILFAAMDESNYDVFLCHCGKQKNFVRQLYKDLTAEDISCFFDEESLQFGQKFPPLIFKAAQTCRIGVAILSKDFIRSKWPLQELSSFVRAKHSGRNPNLVILPIFLGISPNELKNITKDSLEWQRLEENNRVRGEWQDALKEVRSIRGLHLGEDENEVDFRDKLVKEIRRLLLQNQRDSRGKISRLLLQSQSLYSFMLLADLLAAYKPRINMTYLKTNLKRENEGRGRVSPSAST